MTNHCGLIITTIFFFYISWVRRTAAVYLINQTQVPH